MERTERFSEKSSAPSYPSFACIEHGCGSIVRVNQRRGTVKVASTIAEDNEDLLVGVGGFLIMHLYSKGLYPLTLYIFSPRPRSNIHSRELNVSQVFSMIFFLMIFYIDFLMLKNISACIE
jgi:hypothetical protein